MKAKDVMAAANMLRYLDLEGFGATLDTIRKEWKLRLLDADSMRSMVTFLVYSYNRLPLPIQVSHRKDGLTVVRWELDGDGRISIAFKSGDMAEFRAESKIMPDLHLEGTIPVRHVLGFVEKFERLHDAATRAKLADEVKEAGSRLDKLERMANANGLKAENVKRKLLEKEAENKAGQKADSKQETTPKEEN